MGFSKCIITLLIVFTAAGTSARLRSREELQGKDIRPFKSFENIPKSLSLIGLFEEYIYWQDNEDRTQNEAREFCRFNEMQLARFPKGSHLDFVIIEGALENSWTDWTSVYSHSLFKWGNAAAIPSDIPINHYTDLALRLQLDSRNLYGALSNTSLPSICALHLVPENSDVDQTANHTKDISRSIHKEAKNTPRDFSVIGTFDGYTYWQDSTRNTQNGARVFCDSLGMRLVRFKNKAHLDFVIFEGALDGSWTDAISFYTRDLYKTSDGGPLPADIPLIHHTFNLALKINNTCRCFDADNSNFGGASICSLQIAP